MPEPFASIVDRVCDADRKWFNDHPFDLFYDRPYEPGEFWPVAINEQLIVGTRVRLLGPGMRTREPFGART